MSTSTLARRRATGGAKVVDNYSTSVEAAEHVLPAIQRAARGPSF